MCFFWKRVPAGRRGGSGRVHAAEFARREGAQAAWARPTWPPPEGGGRVRSPKIIRALRPLSQLNAKMSALPISALPTWEYSVTRAPGQRVDDKATLFLAGATRDTPYPSFVLDTTRIAFSARPGAMNEKNPAAVAPNTTLNTDVDVPVSAADALRTFDDALHAKVKALLAGTPMSGVVWHSIVHPARVGTAYDDTLTLRISGWTDFVGTVLGRSISYNGNTRTVPGSVTWLPRTAKAQPLREKETAFYRFGSINPVTGGFSYRAQAPGGGGRMVCPGDAPAGTLVKIVFTVSHVLVSTKDLGKPSQEVHANAVLVAKEVYEQPKLAARGSGALLMPGVTVEEEEEEGGAAGDSGYSASFSATTESALAASPPTKRARTE